MVMLSLSASLQHTLRPLASPQDTVLAGHSAAQLGDLLSTENGQAPHRVADWAPRAESAFPNA